MAPPTLTRTASGAAAAGALPRRPPVVPADARWPRLRFRRHFRRALTPEQAQQAPSFGGCVAHDANVVATRSPCNRLPSDRVTRALAQIPHPGRLGQFHLHVVARAAELLTLDQHLDVAAHVRAEMTSQRHLALSPELGCSLLHRCPGDLRHARRRRARPRRDREKRAGTSSRTRRRARSEPANISSVSVGKPAIRSAPKTISERSRRASLAERVPRRRRAWRRFMRFRIMSSPDCSDRCRCGIRRGSSAMASSRCRSASTWSIDDSRKRLSSGTWRRIMRTSLPSVMSPGRSGAVVRDVDAGEYDLGVSRLREFAHLGDDVSGRHRARRSATVGNDAEGAAVVTTVLHLHVSAGAGTEAVDEGVCRLAHRHDVVDLHARAVGEAEPMEGARRASSRRCRLHARPRAWPQSVRVSICAAQPVTMMRALGRSRCSLRMAGAAWRTASPVTAQVLMMTASSSAAAAACPRITSDSNALSRQPSVTTRKPLSLFSPPSLAGRGRRCVVSGRSANFRPSPALRARPRARTRRVPS